MGRYIFRRVITAAILLFHNVDEAHSVMGVGDVVFDPTSFASLGEMIKSGADQLQTAQEGVKTATDQLTTAKEGVTVVQEVANTAKESLGFVTKTLGELEEMNRVLGSPLKSSFFKNMMGLKGVSKDYGNLLGSLSSDSADSLRGVNEFSGSQFGTQDQSNIIGAKDYFQKKFFTEKKSTINLQQAQTIKYGREQASRESVITTLAVSHTHKENLKKDHEELVQISNETKTSGEMNHQTIIHTKLLERIAQNLEKLILLQAQQMDFMAKTYMGDRGVGVGDSSHPKGVNTK